MENVHDVDADVQSDEVGQFERTHGMVHAGLHHGVDRFRCGHALHHAIGCFVDERHEHAVGDEAGRVVDGDRLFAEALGELHCGGKRCVAGLQRADHFHQHHYRHWIHEVHTHEAVRTLG